MKHFIKRESSEKRPRFASYHFAANYKQERQRSIFRPFIHAVTRYIDMDIRASQLDNIAIHSILLIQEEYI